MSRVQSHFSQMQQVTWLTCTLHGHTRRVTHYASMLALFSSILWLFVVVIFFDCGFLRFSLAVRLSIACLLVQCIVINKPNDYVLAALHMDSLVRFSLSLHCLSLAHHFAIVFWSCACARAHIVARNPANTREKKKTSNRRTWESDRKCWNDNE